MSEETNEVVKNGKSGEVKGEKLETGALLDPLKKLVITEGDGKEKTPDPDADTDKGNAPESSGRKRKRHHKHEEKSENGDKDGEKREENHDNAENGEKKRHRRHRKRESSDAKDGEPKEKEKSGEGQEDKDGTELQVEKSPSEKKEQSESTKAVCDSEKDAKENVDEKEKSENEAGASLGKNEDETETETQEKQKESESEKESEEKEQSVTETEVPKKDKESSSNTEKGRSEKKEDKDSSLNEEKEDLTQVEKQSESENKAKEQSANDTEQPTKDNESSAVKEETEKKEDNESSSSQEKKETETPKKDKNASSNEEKEESKKKEDNESSSSQEKEETETLKKDKNASSNEEKKESEKTNKSSDNEDVKVTGDKEETPAEQSNDQTIDANETPANPTDSENNRPHSPHEQTLDSIHKESQSHSDHEQEQEDNNELEKPRIHDVIQPIFTNTPDDLTPSEEENASQTSNDSRENDKRKLELSEVDVPQPEILNPEALEPSQSHSPAKQLTMSLNTESFLITMAEGVGGCGSPPRDSKATTYSGMVVNDDDEQSEDEVPPIATNRIESEFTDEELEAALVRFWRKKQLPPVEMRHDVVNYARKASIIAIVNENYDRAAKLDEAVTEISKVCAEENMSNNASGENENLQQRLERAERSRKETERYWNNIIKSFKEQEKERIREMEYRHENEIQAFEQKWQQPEAMAPFSKPSAQLLQIRRQQKAYAIARNFKGAKAMKQRADALQREETVLAQKRAAEAMRADLKVMLERHEREIKCGEENWARKIETLEKEKSRAVEAKTNLARQLAAKISSPKMPKREKVMLPVIERGQSKDTTITTYRTRSRFAEYKRSPERNKLDVKIDTRNIVRPHTAKTPRRRQNG